MIPSFASTSECKWIYPIFYGGGLVEGDCTDVTLKIGDECAALLTTQGSTKVYSCKDAGVTKQATKCFVGPGAFLALLPDPIVPFKQADYFQSQSIDMASSSNIVVLDWVTAGRIARKEVWDFTRFGSKSCALSLQHMFIPS
ncbi:hypothetical protein CAPTEDRAFT_102157 [Capitella teleta]|uniref:Urease accessory protein UreD n=1 Tax=Capitella teleta TaxID=283909 RepID=R7VKQ5_CAPTE|nr:hypothetical protein CAPTEDRAFT_102157 [Capitella teleta]|eukprot:ELU16965.1 hypothetical protein CAPTEDRAFT_102157 [Capitella teleta]